MLTADEQAFEIKINYQYTMIWLRAKIPLIHQFSWETAVYFIISEISINSE